MEVAQDAYQDQAMEGLQDCFEVKRETLTSSAAEGEPERVAGEASPGGMVSDMIELLDVFGRTQVMVRDSGQNITTTTPQPNHDGLGTLQLTPQRAQKMEATFDLLAKALWRKRQATANRKKQRGGRLEANAAKRDRKAEPAAKPQGRRSGSSTDEEGETSYGIEASPD